LRDGDPRFKRLSMVEQMHKNLNNNAIQEQQILPLQMRVFFLFSSRCKGVETDMMINLVN